MQQHSDEALVAYLDGELDSADQRDVEAWLDADPAARERLTTLARSADLIRSAFADVVTEPVPERLLMAARSAMESGDLRLEVLPTAQILKLPQRRRPIGGGMPRRWYVGMAAAAGLFGVMVGGTGTYVGVEHFTDPGAAAEQKAATVAVNNTWLDNAAGYYKLLASAGGDNNLIDVPASNDPREALQKISQSLPQQVRLPDLKPWGLNFRGARLVVVDGHPAAQLVFGTDNKAIGPLSLIVSASKQADISPSFDRRQDVNLLYWRHSGRAYALVGQTDVGWLWNIANDVAWQLDAI
ncbi:MAG: anti-sigma factor [Alphaproteobacteria bacterium]|nr:anti-sigma factor [Alphaproteobacteria bacterium]